MRSHKFYTILALICLLVLNVKLQAQWSNEISVSAGEAPDLDIDPLSGHLHIVALNNGALYTETDVNGTILNQELVPGTAGITGRWAFGVTVAVDNEGHPHFCYRKYVGDTKYDVYYIYKDATGWSNPLLISNNVLRGYMVRMDIDAGNRVHIVRGSASDGNVWGPVDYFRIENGAVVHTQTGLTNYRADDRVEIDASFSNELHILLGCPDPNGGPVSYWRSTDSGNNINFVGDIHDSAAIDRNGSPDVFVDANGTVHICYGAGKDADLGNTPSVRYSRWEQSTNVLDVPATKQGDCKVWKQDQGLGSIAATANGQTVVIAFTDTDEGDLYTTISYNGGLSWENKEYIAADCGGAESRDKQVIRALGNTFYMVYPTTEIKLRILNDSNDQSPVSDAGGPYNGTVGAAITFDGNGSTDDVAIVNYEWNFGDGQTGIGSQVDHAYASDGTYTASLTVTDSAGQSDIDETVVTIGNIAYDEWSEAIQISSGDTPDFDIHPANGHLHVTAMKDGVTYYELDEWGNILHEEVVPGSENDQGMMYYGASIAVDSEGYPHVGYRYNRGNNRFDVYYTYKTASGWTTPYRVASNILRGYMVRLAIDSADRVYFCHSSVIHTDTNTGPVNLYIFEDGNIVFHQDNINQIRGDSRYELDVSEDGYVDLVAGDLSYPSQGGPVYYWRTAEVGGSLEYIGDIHHEDGKGEPNDSPDVFVDASNNTHICYGMAVDRGINNNPSLRYVRFKNGTKISETRVTEQGELVGWKFNIGIGSIAASADGQTVAAAYLKTEDGDLMSRISSDGGVNWEDHVVLSSGWHCAEGRNKHVLRAHGDAFYLIYPEDGIKLRILGTPMASEPNLAVTPTSLNFENSIDQLSCTVRNIGAGTLNWSVGSVAATWVTDIQPQSGNMEYGQTAEVVVTIDRSGLGDGEYSDILPLLSNGGNINVDLRMQVGSTAIWMINCGANAYTDNDGNEWSADQAYNAGEFGYEGGQVYSIEDPIGNTDSDPLFQSERYNMTAYRFDVPNGDYQVTLNFAEIYYFSDGRRVFSVTLEDSTIINDLDIYQESGHDLALSYTFSTEELGLSVTDNRLDIEFQNSIDVAKISAIKVETLPAQALTPITDLSINSEGGNSLRLSWSASDNAVSYNIYRGTTPFFSPDTPIDNTVDLTYVDNNVTGDPNTNYFYIVTAINAAGESESSNRIGEFDYELITTAKTNFNEIALPLVPTISKASELMALIPNCTSIARWDAASQGYEQYVDWLPPTDFNVEPGFPYYVDVSENSIFTLVGEYSNPVFNLITTTTTNFNEIMLPLDKGSITFASELLGDIPNCTSIARWNAAMQGYEQYVEWLPPTNFNVRVGYPYYVDITDNTTWPAGLAKNVATTSIKGQKSCEVSQSCVPHLVYGKINISPGIDLSKIRFRAYVASRQNELVDNLSVGCKIEIDGTFWVQCANFPSPWKKDENIRIEFYENENNKIWQTYNATLTYNAADEASLLFQAAEKNPQKFELMNNYPNPFNAETIIKYNVPLTGHVELIIYNSLGQKIRTLVNKTITAGSHRIVWNSKADNMADVASGIYFMKIVLNNQQQIKKLLLIR